MPCNAQTAKGKCKNPGQERFNGKCHIKSHHNQTKLKVPQSQKQSTKLLNYRDLRSKYNKLGMNFTDPLSMNFTEAQPNPVNTGQLEYARLRQKNGKLEPHCYGIQSAMKLLQSKGYPSGVFFNETKKPVIESPMTRQSCLLEKQKMKKGSSPAKILKLLKNKNIPEYLKNYIVGKHTEQNYNKLNTRIRTIQKKFKNKI